MLAQLACVPFERCGDRRSRRIYPSTERLTTSFRSGSVPLTATFSRVGAARQCDRPSSISSGYRRSIGAGNPACRSYRSCCLLLVSIHEPDPPKRRSVALQHYSYKKAVATHYASNRSITSAWSVAIATPALALRLPTSSAVHHYRQVGMLQHMPGDPTQDQLAQP
jgi:hypothetical protein